MPLKPTTHPFYEDHADFVVFEKPYGFRTHKVADQQLGLVEVLGQFWKVPLWVVHRLDKETSGCMIFAKNKEAARDMALLFENKQVSKTYYLLTDRSHTKTEFKVLSHIDKVDSSFKNVPGLENNSETHFQFIKKISENCFLWKAHPITGKPHQIRLHSELSKIPILGDHEHGGTPWFRLALHAGEIQFNLNGKDFHFKSALPFSFENLGSAIYLNLKDQWSMLQSLYSFSKDECFRLVHISPLNFQADVYGETLWVYWYNNELPTELDIQDIEKFSSEIQKKYVIRHMINRGQGVGGLEAEKLFPGPAAKSEWTAVENNIHYKLKQNSGFSPGLFLDQSENRKYVRSVVENKTVLNLFSYTSGFSVASALGKASKVTTVDASSSFLDWSKENFRLNYVDPEQHEFFNQDTLLFLAGSKKRGRCWDYIVCDPPSFGRTKTTVWKIEKDLPKLSVALWDCLNAGGEILFTCNYEKWNLSDVIKSFTSSLPRGSFKIKDLPSFRLDIELPDAHSNLTKGFLITKNSK